MSAHQVSASMHRQFIRRISFPKLHCRIRLARAFFLLLFLFVPRQILAASSYYEHVVFDNSLTRDYYFYSYGHVASPSALELDHERIPVESKITLSPPTALRLAWTSVPSGGWTAQIDFVRFRGRPIRFEGSKLYVWCFAPDGLSASA